MHVGTQLAARNDDDYRVFAQLGVNNICGFPPGETTEWTVDNLTRYREHVESFGLSMDVIPLPLSSHEISRAENPHIMLGKSPERDREIEHIQEIIRNCAAAGIPAVKYNMTLLGVVTTNHPEWRGGSHSRRFNFDETPQEPAQTIAGVADADAMRRVRLQLEVERRDGSRFVRVDHELRGIRAGLGRALDLALGEIFPQRSQGLQE